MNLLYGRIVETFPEDGMLVGKIRVGGARKKVSLDLLVEPRIGDRILICDGVAISKVEDKRTTEINYVSGNPG
jgi:hydrogenase maturation factor